MAQADQAVDLVGDVRGFTLGADAQAEAPAVGPNNFAACKQRLLKVIGWCREIGLEVSAKEENDLLASLKTEFEKAVKTQWNREEQARIKEQMREEAKIERERAIELKKIEKEIAAKQADEDRKQAEIDHKQLEAYRARELAKLAQSEEDRARAEQRAALLEEDIERTKAELDVTKAKNAELKEKQRAISNAQLTKAGYIYVTSNIGSFGEGIFKIGMTRRDDPQERINELSNAPAPFPFDVHMTIFCNDAPALEHALRQAFHKVRLNRVNLRKEYFKTNLDAIAQIVKEHHNGDIQTYEVVCHFPPGTSKWNKIEHRMFCHITQNWRGRPLVSHEVIINLIANTTTRQGLRIKAQLDSGTYPTGIKVSDEQLATVNLKPAKFHGEWNYCAHPQQKK